MVFCIVGDDVFFGVVVGVGLVSIIDEILRVFPTSTEQTCRHDTCDKKGEGCGERKYRKAGM